MEQMKATTDADHRTIVDLPGAIEDERDAQDILKNEVAALSMTLHAHEENLKMLEAEVSWLRKVGQKSNSELQQVRDLCHRLKLASTCESFNLLSPFFANV